MIFRAVYAWIVLLVSIPASSSIAQEVAKDPGTIVVIGDRAAQAEIAADQAVAITLRPPADSPLPRHYIPICVKVFGIDPAYGELIEARVRQNSRTLALSTRGPGCRPNVWIGFLRNSKDQVEHLRKQEPAMFESLKSFEIERIFAGSGAAQVWHATEIRSVDGRPIPIVKFILADVAREVEAGYNAQYQGGRLKSPIRNDIEGTILVFDRARANGRTVQQLADYATFRILAPVQDFAKVPPDAMPSILQLFTDGAEPPDGLTEFDWAYLAAFYKLDRGAKVSAIHDATKRKVLDGAGQRLREKGASD